MNEQKLQGSETRINLLMILALLSGCCGLAYEVLYVRALTTILGDMFYVHAALLSTFLVGIGLGSKLAHRFFRWLWLFEILTGLYAIGLPVASQQLSQQSIMILITSSPTLTIVTTICLLCVPSLLIGFSIPLFSAYIKIYRTDSLSFRMIYKVYNLGAFISVLGVELIMIRQLGVNLSLAVVGLINLLNGIILLLMRITQAGRLRANQRSFPVRIVAALALASLGSAVFQMFFLKLSYLVFHPHRENFAIGLSVTMLGLFLGAVLVSKVRIRFETCVVLIAFLVGLTYVGYIPLAKLFEATVPWARSSDILILIHKFLFGCLFALGPMILFGALIPTLMSAEGEVAAESGHLLWISSLANATGYLVYVLLGHPFLTNGVMLAVIAIILLTAGLVAGGFRLSKRQGILAVASVILGIVLIFQWQEKYFYLAHWVNKLKPDDDVMVFKSGAESATLVRCEKGVWISYNGYPSIYAQLGEKVNFSEILVGVAPALSAPRLDRALVIGLGTGISAGTTSRIFKDCDVVEINDAFYKMMPFLRHANLDIENNPSAKLHLTDGRAFLVGKEKVYDAILSTVSSPTYFSASKIYTVEFYEKVAEALKPDGVFTMWVAWGNMSEAGAETILSALRHSFRYCELRFLRGNYYILTCSNRPIVPRRFSELDAHPSLVMRLQHSIPGFDLDKLFDDLRFSDNIFEYFQPDVSKENTDDHPVLEFMVFRDYQMKQMGGDPFMKDQDLFNIDVVRRHQLQGDTGFARRASTLHWLGSGKKGYLNKFNPVLAKEAGPASMFFTQNGIVETAYGKYDNAVEMFNTALHIKSDLAPAHNGLGKVLLLQGKTSQAVTYFQQAIQADPDFIQAYLNLANALMLQDKLDETVQIFRQGLVHNEQPELKGRIVDIHFGLAKALKKLEKPRQAQLEIAKAIRGYRNNLEENHVSIEAIVQLANALAEAGNFGEATEYFQQAVDMYPYDIDNQLSLAEVLVAQKLYDQAAASIEKAIALVSYIGAEKEGITRLKNFLESFENRKLEQNSQVVLADIICL